MIRITGSFILIAGKACVTVISSGIMDGASQGAAQQQHALQRQRGWNLCHCGRCCSGALSGSLSASQSATPHVCAWDTFALGAARNRCCRLLDCCRLVCEVWPALCTGHIACYCAVSGPRLQWLVARPVCGRLGLCLCLAHGALLSPCWRAGLRRGGCWKRIRLSDCCAWTGRHLV